MSRVQITRLFELPLAVDAEAMRAAARHVVEAHLSRLCRRADVEDEEPGARVLAGIALEPFRIDVQQIVADQPQLVHVHARRRFVLPDLPGPGGIAHVVGGEAFRRVERRAADRADIGMTVLDLAQAASTECRRRIVAEQAEILGILDSSCRHSLSPGDIFGSGRRSVPDAQALTLLSHMVA
jgi:hypothetical protein